MDSGILEEQAALVALLRARPGGLSWPEITAEVLVAGSAIDVWQQAVPATLMPAPGEISPQAAAGDIRRWVADGLHLVSVLDGNYPARLRGIQQAPPVLFARGRIVPDDVAVSVVGSREASARGIAMAGELARELVGRKISVVSGLARGIDTAAHRAALAVGGRAVAVIGTGINKAYPGENRELQQEVAARGLLLSQFWPDAPPQKRNFLMRNATMSGYGMATIVVEAGELSGARSQARMAVEHGRQVILTSQVVAQNSWAQALLGRPGVYACASVHSVIDVVEGLVAMWDELQQLVTS